MRDMEYEEIRTRLSISEPLTRALISRRAVLKAIGAGVGVAMIPGWLLEEARAEVAVAADASKGILIVIQLGGGNDGLNTVVPVNDGKYYDIRGDLAIKQTEALSLVAGTALHPSLVNVQKQFLAGKVAIVQGVGYSKPDLSHFQSMATWMSGWGPGGTPRSGWLGRYLDGLQTEHMNGVTIGSSVPLHMQGVKTAATSIPDNKDGLFGVRDADGDPTDLTDIRLFQGVKNLGAPSRDMGERFDAVANTTSQSMNFAAEVAKCYPQKADNSQQFPSHMQLCANLVNANMGVRVIGVEMGSFDTHSNQEWQHKDLLEKLDKGIAAFYASLSPALAGRVTLMTFSEFGRRAESNGGGTDHGTAGPLFVIGDRVAGGLIGKQPSLTDLDSSGNLKSSIPLHSVYGTVLDKWLGADSKELLGAQFETLPLFRGTPA